jgi:hypothetical protein
VKAQLFVEVEMHLVAAGKFSFFSEKRYYRENRTWIPRRQMLVMHALNLKMNQTLLQNLAGSL